MEHLKHHDKPFSNVKQEEETGDRRQETEEEGQKTEGRRQRRREREGKKRFDLTKIITTIFSEENEVDE